MSSCKSVNHNAKLEKKINEIVTKTLSEPLVGIAEVNRSFSLIKNNKKASKGRELYS